MENWFQWCCFKIFCVTNISQKDKGQQIFEISKEVNIKIRILNVTPCNLVNCNSGISRFPCGPND